MTDNVPAAPKTFEERLKERLKESVADLMTDEDLKKLIDRGMEDIFFAGRPNPKHTTYGYGHNEPQFLPSHFKVMLKELMEEKMAEVVKAWLIENQDKVLAAVDETIRLGAGQAMLAAIDMNMRAPLETLRINVQTMMNQPR